MFMLVYIYPSYYCITITIGLIIFKDIKFRGFSNFALNKNFHGKDFKVQPVKLFTART